MDRLNIKAPEALRTWLTTTLEPICDADPAALAKYVMALLKKDKSIADLRDFCIEQLDVFLQSETQGFVDKVFQVVKTGTYMPGAAAVAEPTAPPVETTVSTSTASLSEDASRTTQSISSTTTTSREEVGRRRSRSRDRTGGRREDRRRSPDKRQLRSASKDRRSRSRSPRDRRRPPPSLDGHPAGGRNGREDRRRDERLRDRGRRSSRSRSRSPTAKDRAGLIQRSKAERERGATPPRPLMEIRTESPLLLPPPGTEGAEELDAAIKERRKAKKQRCRDYDEKGYCMRGDRCPFDHGPDPVIVEDTQLPNMIAGTKPIASSAYSLPPPIFKSAVGSSNPPPPGVDSYAPSSTSIPVSIPSVSLAQQPTEAYNPEAPAISSNMDKPYAYPPPPLHNTWTTQPPPSVLQPPFPPRFGPPPGYPPFGPPPTLPPPNLNAHSGLRPLGDQGMRGGRGGGRGGGGLGGRLGPRPPFARPPIATDNKTLEIRKVPPQLNSIIKLNEHFQQFGQIINIQVRYDGDPEAALITFATRPQALNAYKSTSPILNNRFIKVFWHNPDKGTEDAAVVPPLAPNPAPPKIPTDRQAFKKVNTVSELRRESSDEKVSGEIGSRLPAPTFYGREDAVARRQAKKREKEKKLAFLALHKKKTDLLAKQMASQKLLVAQMEKCQGDAAKTKELMSMFKTLDKANKVLSKEVTELAETLKALASGAGTTAGGRTKEMLEKEKLDVELELDKASKQGADTTPLQQKLADLKNELIHLARAKEQSGTTTTPASGGPGRRRQGSESGSGGPPLKRQRSLMMSDKKLDKRPRNIVVTGFKEEQKEALVGHLETFGQITDLDFDTREGTPRAHVTFKTRQQAETALELAEDWDGVQKALLIQWGPSQLQSAAAPNGEIPESKGSEEKESQPTPANVVKRQMSAEEILRSIDDPSDEESEDEEAILNEPQIN